MIKKTDKSGWASPIVVVPKSNNTVRICGDYKVTISGDVEDKLCVLTSTQDLYASLGGSMVFSKLDLQCIPCIVMYVYIQLNVYEESQEYLTINTHKGLYSYKKLPYGVKCVCKQDDILVSSNDWQENLKILVEVWDRLQQYYLHLKLSK